MLASGRRVQYCLTLPPEASIELHLPYAVEFRADLFIPHHSLHPVQFTLMLFPFPVSLHAASLPWEGETQIEHSQHMQ